MKDEKFEHLMEDWMSREIESAPDLKPRPELYRKVQAKRKKSFLVIFPSQVRWAATGIAALLLLFLAIWHPEVFKPSAYSPAPQKQLEQQEPEEAARDEFKTERGAPRRATAVESRREEKRSEKKGAPPGGISSLEFQFQPKDTESILKRNMLLPEDKPLRLSGEDNYRIVLELFEDRHVYIFRLDSKGMLSRLFPNEIYSKKVNPLSRNRPYLWPEAPRWFHPDSDKGEEAIYVITSQRPRGELDDLQTRYSESRSSERRTQVLSALRAELNASESTLPPGTFIRMIKFEIE